MSKENIMLYLLYTYYVNTIKDPDHIRILLLIAVVVAKQTENIKENIDKIQIQLQGHEDRELLLRHARRVGHDLFRSLHIPCRDACKQQQTNDTDQTRAHSHTEQHQDNLRNDQSKQPRDTDRANARQIPPGRHADRHQAQEVHCADKERDEDRSQLVNDTDRSQGNSHRDRKNNEQHFHGRACCAAHRPRKSERDTKLNQHEQKRHRTDTEIIIQTSRIHQKGCQSGEQYTKKHPCIRFEQSSSLIAYTRKRRIIIITVMWHKLPPFIIEPYYTILFFSSYQEAKKRLAPLEISLCG